MNLVDALVHRLAAADNVCFDWRQHFEDHLLKEITQLVGLCVGLAMQVALIRPAFDTYTSREPIIAKLTQG